MSGGDRRIAARPLCSITGLSLASDDILEVPMEDLVWLPLPVRDSPNGCN